MFTHAGPKVGRKPAAERTCTLGRMCKEEEMSLLQDSDSLMD